MVEGSTPSLANNIRFAFFNSIVDAFHSIKHYHVQYSLQNNSKKFLAKLRTAILQIEAQSAKHKELWNQKRADEGKNQHPVARRTQESSTEPSQNIADMTDVRLRWKK